jgi:hypothetical protein
MARRRLDAKERVDALGLDLTHEPLDEICFWTPRSREVVIVGYIVHDDQCSNPIEDCDGMGKFVTKRDAHQFLSHVGRTSDGEPDIDDFIEIIDRLRGQPGDNAYTDSNMEVALRMWEEAYARGKVGTPYAHGVVEKYHGGYEEVDEHKTPEAIWLPDTSLLEHIDSFPESERADEAYKCFNQTLDEYNKWAEGDCYGVVVNEYKRVGPGEYKIKDNDSCWGYIGYDYAKEELKSTFKFNVLSSKKITQNV